MCISPRLSYTLRMQTDIGPITVALSTAASDRVTVNNFVFLAAHHFYDGTAFHRVVTGFVDQGGDPTGTGMGGPGYSFNGGEPTSAAAYRAGTVAMANAGSPASDGSQFFIVIGQAGQELQPLYSVVGQVSSGMAVVNHINADGSGSELGTPKLVHKILGVQISSSSLSSTQAPTTTTTTTTTTTSVPAPPGRATGAVEEVEVPAADLESVGIPGEVSGPVLLSHDPLLTTGGKVEVAYVGGGWCPYCALGNWSLQVALSQFGIFSQLGSPLSSSAADVYPGLESWSFAGARYVSDYFKLDAFQVAQGGSAPVPPGLARLMNKYDAPPYTKYAGGIPFTDLGGQFLVIGTPASVAPLMHLDRAHVAADLRHPGNAVARSVDGAADYLVAAMCLTPGASSAPICDSKFAKRLDAEWAPRFATTTTTSTTTLTDTATTVATTSTTVATTTSSSTTTTTSPTSTTS
jgi:cyclophilin family peptidyl-prolyl cis-trans isomerase